MAALTEGRLDVEVERIVLKGGDGTLVDAIHARPLGLPRSGIVLHPDLMGLRPLFDDLCRRLATHGFAVCCPEPFARLVGLGDPLSDPELRLAGVKELEDDLQLGDLERAADRLVVDDDVSEIAVMGFCMGAMYALKAAATGRFDRAIAFYGMIRVPDDWKSATLAEPLATATDTVPTLAIFGDNDRFTPAADIEALRAAWAGKPDHEIVVYPGAEHGFVHDPERPAHRADDAADAWRRVLAFLGAS